MMRAIPKPDSTHQKSKLPFSFLYSLQRGAQPFTKTEEHVLHCTLKRSDILLFSTFQSALQTVFLESEINDSLKSNPVTLPLLFILLNI